MNDRTYWIGVASKDHVDYAVAGGFTQLNHGKAGPLERMHADDGFVFYSPRTAYPDGEVLQAFTAIGRVASGIVYQATLATDFRPFRIDVHYLPSQPAAIRPLIAQLSFIRSKTYWGAAFRYGTLRIPEADVLLIAEAMGCSLVWAQAPAAEIPAAVG